VEEVDGEGKFLVCPETRLHLEADIPVTVVAEIFPIVVEDQFRGDVGNGRFFPGFFAELFKGEIVRRGSPREENEEGKNEREGGWGR
jgi:hypothetical protein